MLVGSDKATLEQAEITFRCIDVNAAIVVLAAARQMGVELSDDFRRFLGNGSTALLGGIQDGQAVVTTQNAPLDQLVKEGQHDRRSDNRHIALGLVFHGWTLKFPPNSSLGATYGISIITA